MHRRPRLNRHPPGREVLLLRPPAPAAVLTLVALLSGCGLGEQTPAPMADSPACRAAVAAAPTLVLDHGSVPVDGIATRAWGRPPVVVRCGLTEPAATTTSCITVDDVDWVVDPSSDPMTALTYGRSPALEVRVPASLGKDLLPAALVDLRAMAAPLPRTAHACVG